MGEVGSSFHEQDEGVLFDDLQSVTIWSNEEVVRTDERRGEKGRDEVSGEEQGDGNSSGRKEGSLRCQSFCVPRLIVDDVVARV